MYIKYTAVGNYERVSTAGGSGTVLEELDVWLSSDSGIEREEA